MNLFLIPAFLFFVGSVLGWGLEVLFRRFISTANPERKWINPGFCMGPYLPLYGLGLCVLYLIASLERYNLIANPIWNKVALFITMAVCMTVIEYAAGLFVLKIANVRLWDYREEWGNLHGLICPRFSLMWAMLGALYYFLIHPHILTALAWLSENLTFSFVIGLFFGVFIMDFVRSAQLVAKLKQFAKDNEVVVRYENLKAHIRSFHDKNKRKYYFFKPFHTERTLSEYLKEHLSLFEKQTKKKK